MKWKIAALLVMIALPGVIATSWLALPQLVDVSKIPVPLKTLQIATALQGALMVFVAAFIGATLAPRVGLSAPAVCAVVGGGNVIKEVRPQLVPGLVGGCLGAAVIVGFYALSPESLRAVQPVTPQPLAVRVLYGGITEEVIVRWGFMTAMTCVGWKVLQRDQQQPSPGVIWAAIMLSALVFGLLHIPSVAQSLPALSASVAVYITLGNALFGLVAGYLFWRHGLEAAIIAHLSAHVLAFMIRG